MPDNEMQASLDSFLAKESEFKATTLRNNWANSAGTSPDDFAKQIALSRATGIPAQSLAADPEEAQRHAALQGTDFTGLVTTAPKTANFLLDQKNAGLYRDKVPELSVLERAMAGASYLGGSTVAGLHDLAGAGAKMLDAVNPFTLSDQDAAVLFKDQPEKLKQMRENSAAMGLSRFARGQTEKAEKTMEKVSPAAKATYGGLKYATTDTGEAAYLSPIKVVSDALRSLPTSAALATTIILTRGAALKAEQTALASGATAEVARQAGLSAATNMAVKFGAVSEGTIGYAQQALQTQHSVEGVSIDKLSQSPEFQKLLDQGYDENVARIFTAARAGEQAGVGAGFVDAITNAIGGKFLGKIIGEGGNLVPRILKGFANEAGVEFVQSGGEQLFENIAKQANANPGQELSENVIESMLQGLFVGGLTGGAFSGILGRAANETAVEGDAQHLADLFAAAAQVHDRDPETFKQFFQTIAPDATVLIDPDKLQEVLLQADIDPAKLPSFIEQANTSQAGAGIEIPVHELIAAFTGTGAEAALIPHVRFGADMPTLAESREAGTKAAEFFQKEADRILEEQSRNEEFVAGAKAVQDDIKAQLDSLGRFGPQATSGYAALTGAFYTTMASQLGVTPLQLRDGWTDAQGVARKGYKLTIGGAQNPATAQSLNQLEPATRDTFTGAGIPNLLKTDNWTILTAENPNAKQLSDEENLARNAELQQYLTAQGYEFTPVKGHYGQPENSFVVTGITPEQAQALAKKFEQESVLTRHGLVYQDGSITPSNGLTVHPSQPEDFYTTLPDGTHFTVGLDFEGPRQQLSDVLDRAAQTAFRAQELRDDQGRLIAPNGAPSKLSQAQWHQVRSPQFKTWFGDWEAAHNGKDGDGVWAHEDVSKVVDENGEPLVTYHGTEKGGFTSFEPTKGDKHRSPMIFAAATRETALTYAGWGAEIDLTQEDDGLHVTDEGDGAFVITNKDGGMEDGNFYDSRGEAEDALEDLRANTEPDEQQGVYSLFLNIRNPNESNFEGANWDGQRSDSYEVWDTENEENIYTEDGRSVMSEDDAIALAESLGDDGRYETRQAPDHYETTNSVAEDAKKYGNDGAIIREVVDDGGKAGSVSVDDVFVFFNSNQAKSATQNTGGFSADEDSLVNQTARTAEEVKGEMWSLLAKLAETPPEKRAALNTKLGQLQTERKALLDAEYGGPVLHQIPPEQAMQLNTPVELPTSQEFVDAVAGTPGAQITKDGLLIDLVRYQKQEQEGAQAIRTGVFYLPTGAATAKHYKKKGTMASGNEYGGAEEFKGETLVRRPLFVKGATGGKAPEVAYDTLKGKKAYNTMRTDVLHAVAGWGVSESQKIENVKEMLTRYGAEPGLAAEIVRNSRKGNLLPYAVQENIVAHAVRASGYDAVVGYSKGKAGLNISEVFDVREQTFPSRGMASDIHDAYLNQTARDFQTVTSAQIDAIRKEVAWTETGTENGFPTWKNAQVALTSPVDVTEGHDVFYKPLGNERAVKYQIQDANGRSVGYTVLELADGWPTLLLDIEVAETERGKRYAEQTVAAIANDAGELGIWHIVPSARSWWERIGAAPVDEHNGTIDFNGYADARASRENAQGLGKKLYQKAGASKPGAVAGPVVGVHFSREKRGMLSSGAFGTGLTGAERERLQSSNDDRIKQRIAFYVSNGKGVFPEAGVGGVAHVATLTNLYDADADALKLFRSNQRDPNAAESAVVDAGFDGYLRRDSFTNQGTVVMLGARSVSAPHVGGLAEANAQVAVPPPVEIPALKAAAITLANDRTLPGGALTPSEWKVKIEAKHPDIAAQIDFSKFNQAESYYIDQITGALWQEADQWYYSQLRRSVEQAPAKIFATGASIKQWLLSNTGKLGIKKDEIEWTGITDWLDAQPKASKDDVLAFLDQGGVKVEEVMLGSPSTASLEGVLEFQDITRAEWDAADETQRNEWREEYASQSSMNPLETKFAQYVLPGGEKYRELLLTLPSDLSYEVFGNDGVTIKAGFKGQWAARAYAETLGYGKAGVRKVEGTGARTFRSSHFEQANILAHIRFNERTDAEGNRVLFIEEIQSDWGQKGKKEGFATPLQTEGWTAKRGEGDPASGPVWEVRNASGRWVLGVPVSSANDAAAAIARAAQNGTAERGGNQTSVPSAPFVKDTKAWTALAMKRVIAYAAENGFDKVAWTTGEQQAARYDLSQQVSRIEYATTASGKFEISAYDTEGFGAFSEAEIDAARLEEVLGKEITKKIVADEGAIGAWSGNRNWKRLEGIDLKVGGEGMKGFYDQIVPQVARDVLKKLGGGALETISVPRKGREGKSMRPEDVARQKTEGTLTEQPGFSITPEMRATVAQGLPLFAAKNGDKLGSFNPNTLDLRLLADANLSTFLHETGHFFLTVYADLASQPDAPEAITKGMAEILKQFGVADVAAWQAMPLELQRPYHEQFAESFEQYLFTGKAPSLELQPLFQRFASWLTRVYVSIKDFIAGHEGAKLNPELAAVFDRMLATENEIAAANAARGFVALFKDATEAGMSDKDFAAYTALSGDQKTDAEEMLRTRGLRDMKWLENRRNKVIAELQADAKERRDAVLKEVSEEVAATPLRKAMRWLKHGKMTGADGVEIQAPGGNKLQISELEEMFPEGALVAPPDWKKLGYGQYGMLAAEGLSPDLVAEMFGITSGQELVSQLLGATKFADEVNALTDQRMLEQYGDLSSPDAISRAADEAIHNDARTRMVATELSALAKNVGAPSVLMKAAREYARQIVETKSSKTLKPWSFAAAETRAGKAALEALRKGDREKAAGEKRTELVNHVAAKEAYAAEKEIRKIVDRLKAIVAYKDDSSSVKTRDADIVNAVRAILADFGIGTKGKTAREYLAVVQANNPDLAAVLSDTIDAVTAEAKAWQELPLSKLRGLSEEINGLWFLAKRSKQVEIDGKLIPMREAQDAIHERLVEIGIPDHVPGEGSAVTAAEKRGILFDRFVGALRRVESWAGAKDGALTGPFRKFMWNPVRDAANAYRADKVKYLKAYRDLLKPIAPTLTRQTIDAPELGYVFGKDESGMGKAELLHAILHTGNESNKRKLLLGRGWATELMDKSLDTSKWDAFIERMENEGKITKADYDFAQGVWDLMEGMKPLAQKAHRDVFGRYFSEVSADTLKTRFGDYRGGYVPALTDPLIVRDADLRALAETENSNMAFAFPATTKGFTKSRVESYAKPLKLDLRALSQHIDKVLLFSHMTRPVNDVRRMMSGKAVAQALGRVDPQAYNTLIIPWLNRAAKQVVETQTPGREGLGRFWSVVRGRAGMAAMFGNLANATQQVTGLSLAAVRVRPALLLDAMTKYALSPSALAEQITGKSSYMATRLENEVSMMSDQVNDILLNPTIYENAKNWTNRHAYFLQSAVDSVISPVVWLGGYNQAIEAGMSEADAIRAGDSAVRETQGSTAPEDIASFESGTAFYRMFVQFAGYFNMNANLLGTEYVKLTRDIGLRAGVGRGLYLLVLGFLAPAIVGELIMQIFKGGPEDDDKDGEYLDDWLMTLFAYAPARYLTAMVPGFGQVINAAANTLNNKPYDDRISTAPAISMVESAVKAPLSVYKAIAEDGKPSRAIKDVATLISMAVGVPASAAARPISYLSDVAGDRVAPTGPVDLVRGTITGVATPESKQ